MDRLEAMNVFVTAVECGTLSAASRHLGVPLSTVSRKIAELESHLGAQLLQRSSRKVMPTDAGREYLETCRLVLKTVQDAEKAVAGEYRTPRGDLAISAPICFGRNYLLPVVNLFLMAYPEVDVHLLLSDDLVDLQQGELDLALRIAPLPDNGLTATRLAATRIVVCASPKYLELHGRPKHPLELSQHSCVTKTGPLREDMWHFTVDGASMLVPINSRLVVTTTEAAVDAAIAGVGLTRLPWYQVADGYTTNRLEVVLTEHERIVPISFVYNATSRLPLKLRAFLDFVGPRLRDRLQDLHGSGST